LSCLSGLLNFFLAFSLSVSLDCLFACYLSCFLGYVVSKQVRGVADAISERVMLPGVRCEGVVDCSLTLQHSQGRGVASSAAVDDVLAASEYKQIAIVVLPPWQEKPLSLTGAGCFGCTFSHTVYHTDLTMLWCFHRSVGQPDCCLLSSLATTALTTICGL